MSKIQSMAPPRVHPFLMGLVRGTDLETLTPSSPEDRDWEKITRDAALHGLLPILYRWLKTSDSGRVPSAPTLHQIEQRVLGLAARNMLLAQELASILRAFEVRQIACVPLRGLALAELLYGDITARPIGDIDLLVHKKDLRGVANTLKELGFEEIDRRPGFAQAFSYTLEFFKDRHGWVIVEPHWSITYPPFTERVKMEGVWKRVVQGQVVGVDASLLGQADLLVHLCFHLIHRGDNAPLLWLYELDRLVRQEVTALDWSGAVFLARETGLERFVAEVLGKLMDLFDSPIPDGVFSHLGADRRARPAPAFDNRLQDLLAGESGVDGGESFALLFTIKGIRAKLRYAFALLFPSPEFMLVQYGLSSRRQLGLCYLSRVVGFCWEGLKGFRGLLVSHRTPRRSALR